MRLLRPAVTLLLVLVGAAGPALAAQGAPEGVEAGLNWHLAFGGKSVEAGYGLALGYREAGHFSPVSRLLEFKADGAAATATLAGLPLFGRSYQANQAEADALPVEVQKPWYTRSWVLWTAGGLAATAALGGVSGSNSEERHCTGTCNQNQGGGRTTVVTQSGDGTYVGCVQGTCAVCPDGSVQSTCFMDRSAAAPGFEIRLVRDEDAGTGGMGDL